MAQLPSKEEKTTSASIDPNEVKKFSAMADQWWDLHGKFKPLHKFNPTRVSYIAQKAAQHFGTDVNFDPLKGLKLLDVGCGGGLLSEPMRRLGAEVTGIDASEKNIGIASLHAQQTGLNIDYHCASVEALAAGSEQFDIVLTMEVVEHVADVESFLKGCAKLVKPGGLLFVATLNRTLKSYALAIVGAEYVLRWLPRGTHQWEKFLKPSEIEPHLSAAGVMLRELQGVSFNPLHDRWHLSPDLAVNYMMLGVKE